MQYQFFCHQFQTNPEPDLEVVVCSGFGKNGALSVLQVWLSVTLYLPFLHSWTAIAFLHVCACITAWSVWSNDAQQAVLRRWGSSAAGRCGCYNDVWALPGLPQRWLERPLKHPRYSRGTLLMHFTQDAWLDVVGLCAIVFIINLRLHLHLVLTCVLDSLILIVSVVQKASQDAPHEVVWEIIRRLESWKAVNFYEKELLDSFDLLNSS